MPMSLVNDNRGLNNIKEESRTSLEKDNSLPDEDDGATGGTGRSFNKNTPTQIDINVSHLSSE